MSIQNLLLVGAGGFVGSIARYALARSIDDTISKVLPYGTLVVNIVGSFLLGAIYAFTLKRVELSEPVRLLLGAGFCGGFTTFSTFALDNLFLFQQKNIGGSVVYIILSLLFSIMAVWAGFSLVRSL